MKKLKDRLDERLKGEKVAGDSSTASDNEVDKAEGNTEISQQSSKDEAVDSDDDSLPDIDNSDNKNKDNRMIIDHPDSEIISTADSAQLTEANETVSNTDDNDSNKTDDVELTKTDVTETAESEIMEVDNDVMEVDNKVCSSERTDTDMIVEKNDIIEKVRPDSDGEIVSEDNCTENHGFESKDICAENDDNVDPTVSSTNCNTQTPEPPVSENESKDLNLINEKKRNKLSALASIDLSNIKPCLSGNSDTFVCLDEGEPAPANPGVMKLMDRLCQHSAKREKKHPKDLDIRLG